MTDIRKIWFHMQLTFILFLDNNKYVFEHLKPISAADCVKLFLFSGGGGLGYHFHVERISGFSF